MPAIPALLLRAETIACPLTGLAAWLVWRRVDIGLDRKRAALRRWGWLLLLAGIGPSIAPAAPALLVLAAALAAWTALSFRKLQPYAAFLVLPYLLWLIAAAIPWHLPPHPL